MFVGSASTVIDVCKRGLCRSWQKQWEAEGKMLGHKQDADARSNLSDQLGQATAASRDAFLVFSCLVSDVSACFAARVPPSDSDKKLLNERIIKRLISRDDRDGIWMGYGGYAMKHHETQGNRQHETTPTCLEFGHVPSILLY